METVQIRDFSTGHLEQTDDFQSSCGSCADCTKCASFTIPIKGAHSPFRTGGLRLTKQRLAVIDALGKGPHRHVNAGMLHDELTAGGGTISLATIYNVLRDFERVGLLRRIAIPGETVWFDTDTGDHQHFYFSDSDSLADIDGHQFEFQKLPQPPAGYKIARVDTVVHLEREDR